MACKNEVRNARISFSLFVKYIVLYHKEVACLLAVGNVSRELNMIPASDVLQYDYMVMTKFYNLNIFFQSFW